MMKLHRIPALVGAICFFAVGATAQWSFPIGVSDGVNTFTVRFGLASGATDCLDDGIDGGAPPPPFPGAFGTWFQSDNCPNGPEYFWIDYRALTATAKNLDFHYQSGTTNPITLTWDPVVLGGLADSALMVDPFTGTLFSQNMLTTNSLNTGVSPFITNRIRIRLVPDPALPITLVSFTGQATEGNTVRLDWVTLSEVNNFGFFVERKQAGETSFGALPGGFVAGQGTTTEPHSYSYVDATTGGARSTYRLRQVDTDGSFSYSPEVVVDFPTGVGDGGAPVSFALYQNYPNPFNPATEVRYDLATASHVDLHVYNAVGQVVATLVNGEQQAGTHQVRFDASHLSSGVYVYQLRAGDFTATKKLVLAK